MATKIIITGSQVIDKLSVAKSIIAKNDNLSLGSTFSSDPALQLVKDATNYLYFMNNEEINLAFKNNVLLYINTNDFVSTGITLDSFYSNDIFVMNIEDFNNISEHNLANKDILIVWLDTQKYSDKSIQAKDIVECRYLEERLLTFPYLYFIDGSSDEISDIVISYIEGDESEKNAIREENC